MKKMLTLACVCACMLTLPAASLAAISMGSGAKTSTGTKTSTTSGSTGTTGTGTTTTTTIDNGKLSRQDVSWLRISTQVNLAEIQAGKAAERTTKTANVLRLARVLVRDHTKLLTAGQHLARHYGVTVPTAPSAMQMHQMQMVASQHGRAYDVAFLKLQVKGHRQAIRATQTELAKGANSAVKADAKAALGVLQKHLRMAEAALRTYAGNHP